MQGTKRPTVARIFFSAKQTFPYSGRGAVEEYVAAFGPRPIPDRLELPDACYYDEPVLRHQIRNSSIGLMLDGIDHDEGPYADRGGSLGRLSEDVFRDSGRAALEDIERVMDRLRPLDGSPAERMLPRIFGFDRYKLSFDSQLLVPSEVPTAGAIMGQEERHSGDAFTIVHPLEPYILACALLRLRGLLAYPSRAFTGEEGGDAHVPLISVFQSDSSLATFRMLRAHPDIENIEIWSDTAVVGALHAMKAVTLANELATKDVTFFLEGRELPAKSWNEGLSSIAGEFASMSDKFVLPQGGANHLASDSIRMVFAHIYQAEAWKGMRRAFLAEAKPQDAPDLFLQSRGIDFAAPRLPIDQSHARAFLECDEGAAELYPELRHKLFGAWEIAERKADEAVQRIMALFEQKSGVER